MFASLVVISACTRQPVAYVVPTDTNLVDTGSAESAPDSTDSRPVDSDDSDTTDSGESGDTVDTGPCEPTTHYRDADGDGHGNRYDTAIGCEPPDGYVADDVSDCDDRHATAYYGAIERPTDGADNDCDGELSSTSIDDLPLWEVAAAAGSTYLGSNLATGDFDGDGASDFVLSGYQVAYGKEWRQSPAFVFTGPLAPDTVVTQDSAAVTLFGSATDSRSYVCNARDLDGDGFDDLVVTSLWNELSYLARGPLSGTIDLTVGVQTWSGSSTSSGAFGICAGLGDVDGDGLDDVLLSDRYASSDTISYAGAVYLLRGPAEHTSVAEADQVIAGTELNELVGYDIEQLGDLDGDGLGDFGVSSATDGCSYLVTEYTAGVFAPADAGITATGDVNYPFALSRAGDLDGDGYGEVGFAESSYEAGDLWIVDGPFEADAFDVIDSAEIVFSFNRGIAYAAPLTGWNGDGQDAVAIGNGWYSTFTGLSGPNNSGLIYLMAVPIESGTHRPEPDADRIEDPYDDGYLGQIMDGGADLNGDGLSDLAFAMPNVGRAFVLFGGVP